MFPFSHNTELEKAPAPRSELSRVGSLPCCQGTGLAVLLANWFHFPEADPRWHTMLPPHTHPCNPWLLQLSTIHSTGKKESCGYLSQGHLRQTGAQEEEEIGLSRAQEPGSPADPPHLTPRQAVGHPSEHSTRESCSSLRALQSCHQTAHSPC